MQNNIFQIPGHQGLLFLHLHLHHLQNHHHHNPTNGSNKFETKLFFCQDFLNNDLGCIVHTGVWHKWVNNLPQNRHHHSHNHHSLHGLLQQRQGMAFSVMRLFVFVLHLPQWYPLEIIQNSFTIIQQMYSNSEPVTFQNIQWVVFHKIRVLTEQRTSSRFILYKVLGFLCSLDLGAPDKGE